MNFAALVLISVALCSTHQLVGQENNLKITLVHPPSAYKVGDRPLIEIDLSNNSDVPIFIDWRDSSITDSIVYGAYDEDSVPFLLEGATFGTSFQADPVGKSRAKHATKLLPGQVHHSRALLPEIRKTAFNAKILEGGKFRVIINTKLMYTTDLRVSDESWAKSELRIEFPLQILKVGNP